jgi:hypothetical protein
MTLSRRHLLAACIGGVLPSRLAPVNAQAGKGIPLKLTIHRGAETDSCTTGYLAVDGANTCYTLELPDSNNQKYVSRIPRGTYAAHLRYDHADAWRIELEKVPRRANVQIHIGNWPFQTLGCILVGTKVDVAGCSLSGSRAAYDALRVALYGSAKPAAVGHVFDLSVEITGL